MGVRDLANYPWDAVEPYRERAAAHPDGIVDLSIGSPVDPTPEVIRAALAEATDAHAYPQTVGTPALREAIVEPARRAGVRVDLIQNTHAFVCAQAVTSFTTGVSLYLCM